MTEFDTTTGAARVRIDKWLWAARFFKTRNLAKQAIEGGKVQVDGQRVKASKELTTGMQLTIRQGVDEKQVVVTALSDRRRGAPEAALLYEETEDSRVRREAQAQQRKLTNVPGAMHDGRPTKKQRRQIFRFKNIYHDES